MLIHIITSSPNPKGIIDDLRIHIRLWSLRRLLAIGDDSMSACSFMNDPLPIIFEFGLAGKTVILWSLSRLLTVGEKPMIIFFVMNDALTIIFEFVLTGEMVMAQQRNGSADETSGCRQKSLNNGFAQNQNGRWYFVGCIEKFV